MKHRLVTAGQAVRLAKEVKKVPHIAAQIDKVFRLDGLRVTLGPAGGLVAITNHGLEVPLTLDLAGLNKLHELLVEQQRVKEVPPLGVTPTYILAEWRRLPGEGNGKVHKTVASATVSRSAKRAYTLEDLL